MLVIDDESSVGWLVRACLPMHEVQTTTDPLEGLSLLAEQRYDVVLCDYDMPGMNGLELYRVVRQRHPELSKSFSLMVGGLDSRAQAEAAQSGLPMMQKPFSLAQLESYVSSHARSEAAKA